MTKSLVAMTICLISAVVLPAAAADKTYTNQQLKQMVDAGKLPPQHEPVQRVDTIDFVTCKSMVHNAARNVGDSYPVRTLIDTAQMLSIKIWTNDGALVMSCSKDGKFVMQQSKYR